MTVWEGVVTDITDRVVAQQELERSLHREMVNKQQRRTLLEQKLKTSLTTAAMVHEIQQPLAAILINARLASRELASLPAAARPAALERQLEALAVDGDQAVEAMERIRVLLRNVETKPTPIDITTSLDSALLYVDAELRQGGVAVHVEGMDRPCVLQGDGAQLKIALVNLIRNALQAMRDQPEQSRALRLEVYRSADQVELRVDDSGPGFPSDCSPATGWELFKSTKANGMGLGLFLAQTAAMNHGGTLRIGHSAHLGGAAVVICLPLNRLHAEPQPSRGVSLSR